MILGRISSLPAEDPLRDPARGVHPEVRYEPRKTRLCGAVEWPQAETVRVAQDRRAR